MPRLSTGCATRSSPKRKHAPWIAVGFGVGILLYFAAPSEPTPYAAVIAVVLFAALAWWSRERSFAFALAIALTSVAAGFGAGCLRGAMVAHPVLTRATGMVTLTGFVEARDATERSDRIVLRLTSTSGPGAERISAPRLRFAGLPFLAFAAGLFVSAPRPDVSVGADGSAVAVRGGDGKLKILNARSARLEASSWLAADADGRTINNQLAAGFTCDDAGRVTRMADGVIVAVPRQPEAFADDCKEAALIVTVLDVPAFCKVPVIDRRTLATTGAIALRRVDGRWIAGAARSPYAVRPWYGRTSPPDGSVLLSLKGTAAHDPAPSRDVPDDLSDEAPTPDLPKAEDQ